MADLSIQPNRAYPSIPAVTDDTTTHTNALQQVRESIETHERRNANYLKSFVRFEELVALGIIDDSGTNLLTISSGGESGSATTLDGLSDVVITVPADNEMLGYDVGSTNWINQTASQLGLSEIGHLHDLGDIFGTAELNDLSDVDSTGSHPYDLLFKSISGSWIHTNQLLQWNGSDVHIAGGGINFYVEGASTPLQSIKQDFPAAGDLSFQAPFGDITLQPGADVVLSPDSQAVRVDDSQVFMDNYRGIRWNHSGGNN